MLQIPVALELQVVVVVVIAVVIVVAATILEIVITRKVAIVKTETVVAIDNSDTIIDTEENDSVKSHSMFNIVQHSSSGRYNGSKRSSRSSVSHENVGRRREYIIHSNINCLPLAQFRSSEPTHQSADQLTLV